MFKILPNNKLTQKIVKVFQMTTRSLLFWAMFINSWTADSKILHPAFDFLANYKVHNEIKNLTQFMTYLK